MSAMLRESGREGAGSAPWTRTVSPGSILPEFGRTQYCFGAVVFTLNATGWELLFETASVRFTSDVSGRGNPSDCAGCRVTLILGSIRGGGVGASGRRQATKRNSSRFEQQKRNLAKSPTSPFYCESDQFPVRQCAADATTEFINPAEDFPKTDSIPPLPPAPACCPRCDRNGERCVGGEREGAALFYSEWEKVEFLRVGAGKSAGAFETRERFAGEELCSVDPVARELSSFVGCFDLKSACDGTKGSAQISRFATKETHDVSLILEVSVGASIRR